MKTSVAIIGAGPAGLVLAHLLHQRGVDCLVLEARSREYVEARIRAGVLEQGSVEILDELDISSRLHRDGMVHRGIELGFAHTRHRIDFPSRTGKSVTVYGQHEVVKDLIAGAEERKIPIHFNVSNVSLRDVESAQPSVSCTIADQHQTIECDYIAGCDGFHGVSRRAIPEGLLTTYERTYPYSWLGILADAKPSQEELVYMHSERGFALFSMRSPTVTRLYLQVDAADDMGNWSNDRVWSELFARFTCNDGWKPNEGPILQKSITPMRSFVTAPMQFEKLFLAGDAVHIVPPTGAKGMNLAVSDVKVLAEGLAARYTRNDDSLLKRYSEICLRRVWKAQRFSWWMTTMLHMNRAPNTFDYQRQIAELDYVTSSEAAATSLAENYVGLPITLD